MLRLVKYNVIVKLKNFNTLFWPLVFPLLLGTMFYFAFGNIDEADFETVITACVEEEGSDKAFLEFLQTIQTDEEHLIEVQKMNEDEAVRALEAREISGIYYVGKTPSLTVGSNGLSESILQSLLESYIMGRQTMEKVMEEHPEGMEKAVAAMSNYQELVEQVSLGGRTTNGNAQFFYALIAMACLYGAFIGFGSALELQANLTPLGARRCVTPTHKMKIILADMMSSFLLHFLNVIILLIYLRYVLELDFQGKLSEMLLISFIGCVIGVSMGIFIGSLGKMGEGIKIAILLGVSMTCSFLAGLMNSNVKDIVEKYAPFVNRINPAALISDAFYCINVYDDTRRYTQSLITLGGIGILMLAASFLLVRRERYDSI